MKVCVVLIALCAMLIPSVALGATFGKTTNGATAGLTIESQMVGASSPAGCNTPMLPSVAGDVDSMTFRIRFTSTAPPSTIKLRCGLYEYATAGIFGANPPLVDSCARETTYTITASPETVWVSFPVAIGYTVDPSAYAYLAAVWGQPSTHTALLMYDASTPDTSISANIAYVGAAVPNPMFPTGVNGTRAYSAYVTYTPTPSGFNPRELFIKKRRGYSNFRSSCEVFAGGKNEFPH